MKKHLMTPLVITTHVIMRNINTLSIHNRVKDMVLIPVRQKLSITSKIRFDHHQSQFLRHHDPSVSPIYPYIFLILYLSLLLTPCILKQCEVKRFTIELGFSLELKNYGKILCLLYHIIKDVFLLYKNKEKYNNTKREKKKRKMSL